MERKTVLLILIFLSNYLLAQKQIDSIEELYTKGMSEYANKNYKLALDYFQKGHDLEITQIDSTSNVHIYAKVWIANCYCKLGEKEKAKEISPQDFLTPPIDRNKTIQSDSLYLLANTCMNKQDYSRALNYLNIVKGIEAQVLGLQHPWYANTLALMMVCEINLRNLTEAYNLAVSCEKIYSLYETYSDEKKTFSHFSKQLLAFAPSDDKEKELNLIIGKYENANEGDEKDNIAYECAKIAYNIEDFSSAEKYARKAIQKKEIATDADGERWLLLISSLVKMEQYEKAIIEANQLLSSCTNDSLRVYGETLKMLGELYYGRGDYYSATEMFTKLYTLNNIYHSHDKETKLVVLNSLISSYHPIKDYPNALKYAKELIAEYRNNPSLLDNFSKSLSLVNAGLVFSYSHDIENTIYTARTILEIADRLFDKTSIEYATSIMWWAGLVSNSDDVFNYIDLNDFNANANKLSSIQIDSLLWASTSNEMKSHFLSGICLVLQSAVKYGSMLSNFIELADICQELIPNTENYNLIRFEFNRQLGNYYTTIGDYTKAYTKFKACQNKVVGGNPTSRAIALGLGESASGIGRSLEALKYFEQVVDNITDEVCFNFKGLTSSERYGYFKSFIGSFERINYHAFLKKENNIMATVGYNIQLLSKGILLHTDISIRQIIRENGDSTIISTYNKLQLLVDSCNYLNKIGKYNHAKDVKIEANKLEQILLTKSKQYEDYMASYVTNWEDVQNSLNDLSTAVEFVSYRDMKDRKIYYGAYVLKSEGNPICIKLCEEEKLKSIGLDYKGLYSIIWKPILEQSPHSKNIYFSPTGILNKLPIENNEGSNSNQISFYRLSSTREITTKHEKKKRSIVIYGGLDYGSENSKETRPSSYDLSTKSLFLFRGAIKDIQYLPGTKKEIDSIASIIGNVEGTMSVKIYTDSEGTEDTFKRIDGENTDIIHMATHGFFFDDNTALWKDSHLTQTINENNDEDIILSRSGLYLAGANYIGYNKSNSLQSDDGILTSLEISIIDLRNLNIVVLSACDSGLGEINYDGVFGLQRGLKKAGVQSVLMSLWKVDDEATCLLMTEFYRHWIGASKTKHDALELAKQSVRSHKEKGWDDPKYWAAFILLDGLD